MNKAAPPYQCDCGKVALFPGPELKIDSMFEATKNNLINDWKYLILLTIICLFVSGILLYKKVNYDENK